MKYTVIAPITLGPGIVLGLSDAQATPRSGSLRSLGKGKYEVCAPVQFKAGEVIHTDAELPKALAEAVELKKREKAEAAPVETAE